MHDTDYIFLWEGTHWRRYLASSMWWLSDKKYMFAANERHYLTLMNVCGYFLERDKALE